MRDRNNGIWVLLVVAAFVVGFLLGAFTQAAAQTPPISQVEALADTTYGTLDIFLEVSVQSSIPWDGQFVGVYWTADPLEGWNYAGATRDTITWQAPADNLEYHFSSTVDDDDGNSEGYDFTSEASTFVCSTCTPTDPTCPPLTTLEHVQALAVAGFDLEAGYDVLYHWTHPTTGTPVHHYVGEWEVDGTVGNLPNIINDEPDFGHVTLPYTVGSSQRLRVAGVDDQDRQGPWSEWSSMLIDDGPPGQPGAVQHTRDQ